MWPYVCGRESVCGCEHGCGPICVGMNAGVALLCVGVSVCVCVCGREHRCGPIVQVALCGPHYCVCVCVCVAPKEFKRYHNTSVCGTDIIKNQY